MEEPIKEPQENPFGMTNGNTDPKTIGIIAYLTLVGWIVAIVLNNPKTEYASFHLRQSLGLIALGAAAGMVGIVPILGWIAAILVWIATAFLWIIAFLGALQGEKKVVPWVGEYFQQWFKAL